VLPNLYVIGAAKCGTSSLHDYLNAHPEVWMSDQKELHFFVKDDWREKQAWYEDQFQDLPVRGESSPTYSMYPYLPSTAERMRELTPDARFIYLVRPPIERAIANYVELVALRLEDRPISAALTDFADPANPHLCPSRYASQIERFIENFGEDRVLVIEQQDLRERRLETLRRIFAFIGVDAGFTSERFLAEHNTKSAKVQYNDLGFWLVGRRILTEKNGPFNTGPLREPLRSLLSKPIDRDLSGDAREAVAENLRPEVERLRELTGLQLAGWDAAPA
jgi:hypothetical protein